MNITITKYVHSCLLITITEQTNNNLHQIKRVAIFDPGNFSWESGIFNISQIDQLDDIIITHEHPDHMHIPFLQELTNKFPDVLITTNKDAAMQLGLQGFKNISSQNSQQIKLFQAAHESNLPFMNPPANTGIHYLDVITNPGDCHHFGESKSILILPITAPWGTLTRAAELGVELKPSYIIPVHDWHYNDDARKMTYKRLDIFFEQHDIKFLNIEDGIPLHITL